jgi:hypothetical protein
MAPLGDANGQAKSSRPSSADGRAGEGMGTHTRLTGAPAACSARLTSTSTTLHTRVAAWGALLKLRRAGKQPSVALGWGHVQARICKSVSHCVGPQCPTPWGPAGVKGVACSAQLHHLLRCSAARKKSAHLPGRPVGVPWHARILPLPAASPAAERCFEVRYSVSWSPAPKAKASPVSRLFCDIRTDTLQQGQPSRESTGVGKGWVHRRQGRQ